MNQNLTHPRLSSKDARKCWSNISLAVRLRSNVDYIVVSLDSTHGLNRSAEYKKLFLHRNETKK